MGMGLVFHPYPSSSCQPYETNKTFMIVTRDSDVSSSGRIERSDALTLPAERVDLWQRTVQSTANAVHALRVSLHMRQTK